MGGTPAPRIYNDIFIFRDGIRSDGDFRSGGVIRSDDGISGGGGISSGGGGGGGGGGGRSRWCRHRDSYVSTKEGQIETVEGIGEGRGRDALERRLSAHLRGRGCVLDRVGGLLCMCSARADPGI